MDEQAARGVGVIEGGDACEREAAEHLEGDRLIRVVEELRHHLRGRILLVPGEPMLDTETLRALERRDQRVQGAGGLGPLAIILETIHRCGIAHGMALCEST